MTKERWNQIREEMILIEETNLLEYGGKPVMPALLDEIERSLHWD